jgi:hypothetical protein
MEICLAYSIVLCIAVISLSFYGGYRYAKKKETFVVRKNGSDKTEHRLIFMMDLDTISRNLDTIYFCRHTNTTEIKEVNKIIVKYMTAAIGNNTRYPISLYTNSDFGSIRETARKNLRTLEYYYRYGNGVEYVANSFDYDRVRELIRTLQVACGSSTIMP